ncbi:MAG: HAD family hydrolase [Bacteroidales bacterium]|nr:HAD family hydrolase [Bacteroidales bacterium]
MDTSSLKNIKGIIFDYGGTLDSGGDHWSEVIYDAWQKSGIAVGKPQFREAYVFAERELARVRHILPSHDFHDLLLVKMRLELQHISEEGLFPPALVEEKAAEAARICYESAKSHVKAAEPVLALLAKHFPMVLVSNFYGNVETVLKDFGIDKYFKKIVESAVVGVRKPDPEIFRLGVKDLNLPADEVLVVGDSYRKDILPAREAGCAVLWLKGKGWTPEEDEQTDPCIISSLDEIPELLGLR